MTEPYLDAQEQNLPEGAEVPDHPNAARPDAAADRRSAGQQSTGVGEPVTETPDVTPEAEYPDVGVQNPAEVDDPGHPDWSPDLDEPEVES